MDWNREESCTTKSGLTQRDGKWVLDLQLAPNENIQLRQRAKPNTQKPGGLEEKKKKILNKNFGPPSLTLKNSGPPTKRWPPSGNK